MNIAGKEVPTPVVAIGGGAALFFVYRWYKNRAGSSTTTTGSSSGGVTGSPGPRGTTGPPGPAGSAANTNWLQSQVNDLYRNVRLLNKTKADKPPPRKGKSKPNAPAKTANQAQPGATMRTQGQTPQPGPGKRPIKTAMVPARGQ